MTPEAINIAIAKACGWVQAHVTPEQSARFGVTKHFKAWFPPDAREWDDLGCPNYTGSLDAMAGAEATLTGIEPDVYANHLCDAINAARLDSYGDPENGSPQLAWPGVFQVAHATAAQRAEAFLRTRGLWT